MAGLKQLRRQLPLYQSLCDAYREFGPAHTKISRACLCSPAMAKRAYDEGWPEFEWAPPIKDLLALEGRAVRSKLEFSEEVVKNLLKDPDVIDKLRAQVRQEAYAAAEEESKKRFTSEDQIKERAALNALKTREEEAEIARLMRGRGRLMMSGGATAMPEFMRMGDLLRRRMKLINDTKDDKLELVDPHDLLLLMSKFADLQLKIGMLVQAAQVVDRKAAGDPDFVHVHKTTEMSLEEAQEVLRGAQAMSASNGLTAADFEDGALN